MFNMENNNENKKDLFATNLKSGAKAALKWAKETGELAKEKASDAKNWVDDKTPEMLERLNDAAYAAKEGAEDAAQWVDASAKKTKAWIDAQNEANAQRKMSYELSTLKPIFDDNMPTSFEDYPVINILRKDERRSKSEVCKGSYGFMNDTKELEVPSIYVSSFDKFGITLNGPVEEGVYYANPYIPGEYIEANEYAIYMKTERVRELVQVADSLGAKYVSVSFDVKEKQTENTKGILNGALGKNKAQAEAEHELLKSLELSIGKTRTFGGHDKPERPELVYYKNDKDILNLIESRISGKNILNKETYSVTYASISQSKLKEAAKVDGAVKTLKFNVNQQLSTCYAVESVIKLTYTIEF